MFQLIAKSVLIFCKSLDAASAKRSIFWTRTLRVITEVRIGNNRVDAII